MRKLLKSRKALSPVVAAIILIAVTVAVSIAVAAWMGALTFTFMKTEELKIISVAFTAGPPKTTVITVTNTGSNTLSVSSVTVDDAALTPSAWGGSFSGTTHDLVKGATGTITVNNWNWTSGYKYTFALLTPSGNKYTYQTTASP
jgi:flagellin-like protein